MPYDEDAYGRKTFYYENVSSLAIPPCTLAAGKVTEDKEFTWQQQLA